MEERHFGLKATGPTLERWESGSSVRDADDFLGKADAGPHSSKRQLQDGEGMAREKTRWGGEEGISATSELSARENLKGLCTGVLGSPSSSPRARLWKHNRGPP